MVAIKEGMCEDLTASRESMQRELERHREMIEQYEQRINSMFNMLSSLPQFRLLLEFPPPSVADSSMVRQGIPLGVVEAGNSPKEELGVR